jgi:hypothetical protein
MMMMMIYFFINTDYFSKARGNKGGGGLMPGLGPFLFMLAPIMHLYKATDKEAVVKSEHTPTYKKPLLSYLEVRNISTTKTERKGSLQKPRH